MWSAPPPKRSLAEFLDACTSGRDSATKRALRKGRPDLERISTVYEAAARAEKCWDMPQLDRHSADVSSRHMKKAYKNILVNGQGRRFYDEILANAYLHKCVYCNHSEVMNVDHIQAISQFSALALDPLNLVGACHRCNKNLSDTVGDSAETENIHPYFWLDTEAWLGGTLHRHPELFIEFQVECPTNWAPRQKARVQHYYKSLNLAQTLGEASVGQIVNVLTSMNAGLRTLRDPSTGFTNNLNLDSFARSFLDNEHLEIVGRFGISDWRVAVNKALSADEWFINNWSSL